jgi:LacI family gluconate utilization system Gnt-I transcriptional repressor
MLIGFSHLEIGRAVAKYLMDKGRKRFALVLAGDERADRRASAFKQAVQAAGLGEVLTINVGESRTLKSGRDALKQILQSSRKAKTASKPMALPVDAIFCSSDLLAMGVVTEAIARGIQVPKALAVMGFGDVPFGADVEPALSTVRINGSDIGRMAAQYLMARAEGQTVDQPIRDVGFSILERGTS